MYRKKKYSDFLGLINAILSPDAEFKCIIVQSSLVESCKFVVLSFGFVISRNVKFIFPGAPFLH